MHSQNPGNSGIYSSMENLASNGSFHRSVSSSRIVDCSLRVYRQPLPLCIPENEPISFGPDELEEHEEVASSTNVSDFLFCSPKGRSPAMLQTVKQQPRIYPKSISKLMASSPAHQNQFRLFRGMGQHMTAAGTLPLPAAPSPCLSPIRYSLDLSAIQQLHIHEKSGQIDEEPIEVAPSIQHRSFPADDTSLKVRFFAFGKTSANFSFLSVSFQSVCLAQNLSTGRILTDITHNTSIRSSFLRSPRPANVSGPVLGTPDYLSKNILKIFTSRTIEKKISWFFSVLLFKVQKF